VTYYDLTTTIDEDSLLVNPTLNVFFPTEEQPELIKALCRLIVLNHKVELVCLTTSQKTHVFMVKFGDWFHYPDRIKQASKSRQ